MGRRLHVLAAAVQRDITAAHEDLVYTLDWQASHMLPPSAPPLQRMTGQFAQERIGRSDTGRHMKPNGLGQSCQGM